jgi:hypothetical protein
MARTKQVARVSSTGQAAIKTATGRLRLEKHPPAKFTKKTTRQEEESKEEEEKQPRRKHAKWKGKVREFMKVQYLKVRKVKSALRAQRVEMRCTDPIVNGAASRRSVLNAVTQCTGTEDTRIGLGFVQAVHRVTEDNVGTIATRAVRLLSMNRMRNRCGESIPRSVQLMGCHMIEAFHSWCEDNQPQTWDRFIDVVTQYDLYEFTNLLSEPRSKP